MSSHYHFEACGRKTQFAKNVESVSPQVH